VHRFLPTLHGRLADFGAQLALKALGLGLRGGELLKLPSGVLAGFLCQKFGDAESLSLG
jgi:hypothetical protein